MLTGWNRFGRLFTSPEEIGHGEKTHLEDIGLTFGEFTCYAASAGVIDRVLGRNLKSAEEAKSLAEQDYASLSK